MVGPLCHSSKLREMTPLFTLQLSYFCKSCEHCDSTGWIKIFGEGTKVIVTAPDISLDADISPKPTIFLPSIAETNLHNAGTYLCLLEKFFPDVIKVHWKEKGDNKVLESQQGNTMKTNDTYMKFSWLTVSGKAMNKEHNCIVKHENNKKGVDQYILFPPIKKVSMDPTTCSNDENDVLRVQLTNTSAYYTYLLLLLKSTVHLAIVIFCLYRRTDMCGNGKTS
nr:TCR gamma alternate reading frame protein [Castor canadensis]